MKIVVDNKIPYLEGVMEKMGHKVVYLPGSEITAEAVRDASALIVRTRTVCDRALLEGSRVRFIATATIGFDHIDTDYCQKAGIMWTNAPGCNAAAVGQYVQSVLILWERDAQRRLQGLTLGIVGAGHVGMEVSRVAHRLGMNVLFNDPPRAGREGGNFYSLQEIARWSDVISFHTPLVRDGDHPTYHLADEAFFRSLARRPLLVNTSRGEVVDTPALKQALETGMIAGAVIDTWEHEPSIDRSLLRQVFIGTPHIAGYSADGKANATRMSLDALCGFFRISAQYDIQPPAPSCPVVEAPTEKEALLRIYNPADDYRALLVAPSRFETLRGEYHLRREPCAYQIRLRE